MKKARSISLTLIIVLFVSVLSQVRAQEAPRNNTVMIHVIGTGNPEKELEVRVNPWRITINSGENIEWMLRIGGNLTASFRVTDEGKECGNLEFPRGEKIADGWRHGAFEEPHLGWCSYNIEVWTSIGHDIKIDPDYRIVPRGIRPPD